MSKVALLVKLELIPGQKAAFLERVRKHATLVLEKEPECSAFTVLDPQEESDVVWLCEVYADQAAVDHHLSTPYMKQYLEDTGPMIADRERKLCAVPDPI